MQRLISSRVNQEAQVNVNTIIVTVLQLTAQEYVF